VAAYGEIDETNAAIGMVISVCNDDVIADILQRIQSDLFILGVELATQKNKRPDLTIEDTHIGQLERWIDEASGEIEPPKNLILPGGCETASRLHLARTVCRRAERAAVTLAKGQSVRRTASVYLNRLSDLLFALARRANRRAGIAEIPWTAPKG